MFLTKEDLIDLTGYRSAKNQCAWLRARGWVFELNRLDQPKVDREYYRSKMGNNAAEAATVEPNWSAL